MICGDVCGGCVNWDPHCCQRAACMHVGLPARASEAHVCTHVAAHAGEPDTAEEYLRRVRYEAERCPKVSRAWQDLLAAAVCAEGLAGFAGHQAVHGVNETPSGIR